MAVTTATIPPAAAMAALFFSLPVERLTRAPHALRWTPIACLCSPMAITINLIPWSLATAFWFASWWPVKLNMAPQPCSWMSASALCSPIHFKIGPGQSLKTLRSAPSASKTPVARTAKAPRALRINTTSFPFLDMACRIGFVAPTSFVA